MSVQNVVRAFPASSFDSADMTISYQPINVAPLAAAVFYMRILNDSTKDVTISFNGTTDHFYLVANTVMELNMNAYAQPSSNAPVFQKNLTVYVRGLEAGTGRIILSTLYQGVV